MRSNLVEPLVLISSRVLVSRQLVAKNGLLGVRGVRLGLT